MKTVALFGANGFVGGEILKAFHQANQSADQSSNYSVSSITRENFENFMGKSYDYVINAAMPSARFKAKNDPLWDFRESVEKTAKMYYGFKCKKFIQISSISARCQPDTIYGRHKLAAESLVDDGNSLIVRLGPMYASTLSKGVLIDMLRGGKVFVGADSRYAFAPLSFIGKWIVNNLDRKGIVEVGAKNSIALGELARKLNLDVHFEGKDDHQEILGHENDFPDVEVVFDFMREQQRKLK
ncbi:MAG: hypothetical protein Q8R47_04070 [Nanoarchaeota archaeon]|nr:hypothetical protein [Nanoarchaeota archaeon]